MKKMKLNIIAITMMVFCAATGLFAQEKDSKMSKDEAAIRANVEQMAKGWNMKSGAEFAKPFAEDSDYVVVNGMHVKGRAANAEAHQRIFDTIYKDSSIVPTIKQIRFLRPDVAVVHGVSNLTFRTAAGEEKKGSGMITLVMTKEKRKWSIAAFQNTAIQPPGR